MKQITNTILMIRPVAFRMNEQTAVDNYYQSAPNLSASEVQIKSLEEFNGLVESLRNIGVNIIVVEDTEEPNTPDSIFPNNWVSFHENGAVVTYPMFAENRRLERREDIFEIVKKEGFDINKIVDYSDYENEEIFLEGTGSMVLDRENKKAYCSLSERSNEGLFLKFCSDFNYLPIVFKSYQSVGNEKKLIYHTNVMMSIAETFAVVFLEGIYDEKERENLINNLNESGKEIISITENQVNNFAGNMLQVIGANDKRYLIMSKSAYKILTEEQIIKLKSHCDIIYNDVGTIEDCGGGSVRCTMAEVFLKKIK